jgi:hypothetical protein
LTWLQTLRATQIPPGSASPSSRAARLTPVDVVAFDDHVANVDPDAALSAGTSSAF